MDHADPVPDHPFHLPHQHPFIHSLTPTFHALMDHFSSNWMDSGIWLLRMLTLLFSFLYAIPVFGIEVETSFQKALLTNAATSSLRLSQSLPHNPDGGQSTLKKILNDDNFHYLMYSVIFLHSPPHLTILFPLFLLSLLHSSGFSIVVLEKANQGLSLAANYLRFLQNEGQAEVLLSIAYSEIFLFPYLLIMVYLGSSSISSLFFLAQFLNLRYMSRHNPFTRQAFRELRVKAELHLVNNPECPGLMRLVVSRVIETLEMLAPQVYAGDH